MKDTHIRSVFFYYYFFIGGINQGNGNTNTSITSADNQFFLLGQHACAKSYETVTLCGESLELHKEMPHILYLTDMWQDISLNKISKKNKMQQMFHILYNG